MQQKKKGFREQQSNIFVRLFQRMNSAFSQHQSLKVIAIALFFFVAVGYASGAFNVHVSDANGLQISGEKIWKTEECVAAPTGGKGDYIGNDAIQDCIDSLSGGGTVYIREGTYTISKTINVTSNTRLIGDGMNMTIIKQADSNNEVGMIEGFQHDGAIRQAHIYMEGFTVDCNVANQNYENFSAAGSHGAGLRLITDYSVYKDIFIQNCAQFGGIVLYGRHNQFDNIWVKGTRNVTNSTSASYATGMFITSVGADNNVVNNFHCRDVDGHCIFLEDNVHGTVITNLDVDGCWNGLNIYQANYTTVNGALIQNCLSRGVVVSASDHTTITGVVVHNLTNGFLEQTPSDYTIVWGNDFSHATTPVDTSYAGTNSVYGANGGSTYWNFAAGVLTDIATVNTGQGNYELFAMNQDVESTDAVTFATVDTGQGANELYDMDQNVQTTSNVVFNTVNTSTGKVIDDSNGVIDLTDELLVYITFNTNGSAEDYAGYTDGAITNAVWTKSGKFAGAYNYDGRDDKILTTDSGLDENSTWSVSVWAYDTQAGDSVRRIVWQTGSWGLYVDTTDIIKFGTAVSSVYDGFVKDQWNHVVATYDGTNQRLYYNGVLRDTDANPSITPLATGLEIGNRDGPDQDWNGSIDELAIWQKTLTNAEVLAIYEGRTNLGSYMRMS